MTRTMVRVLAASVIALGVVAPAAAQEAQWHPVMLTRIEVRQLVASTNHADQTRLADHFLALAATYDADAARHEAMACAFTGHARRRNAVDAALARSSAMLAREVASHFDRLSAGEASTMPAGAGRFLRGAASR